MKIDNETIVVLKNFARINQSILVNPGNELKTISPIKTIVAKAKVSTKFNNKFAIYNLDRFISVLSLFKDPNLTFNDKNVTISDGRRSVNYTYCDEGVITKAPDKDITLPSNDVSFDLTNEDLQDVLKALSVLGLPNIVVSGNGEDILLQAVDVSNPTADTHSIKIGSTDKKFKAIFKAENIRIIPDTYKVSISSKGISHFKGTVAEYYIAIEQNSTF